MHETNIFLLAFILFKHKFLNDFGKFLIHFFLEKFLTSFNYSELKKVRNCVYFSC